MSSSKPIFRIFDSPQPYSDIFAQMKRFTQERDSTQDDEIWLLEHQGVFTQGQAGKPEHVLNPGNIPIVQSDRGGQVTYHGPGQLMIYPLVNLKRRDWGVKAFVCLLEDSMITLLNNYGIPAHTKTGAPGVYTSKGKICSLGLRIKKGASYHGLCLNVAMDLTPFTRINPCGFTNMAMTDIHSFYPAITIKQVQKDIQALYSELF